MLGIGMGEMIIIGGIALVVIGPEKFPEFAKIILRTFRDVRSYVDEAKSEITREIAPMKKEFDELSRYDPEEYLDNLIGKEDDNGYSDEPYEREHEMDNTPRPDATQENAYPDDAYDDQPVDLDREDEGLLNYNIPEQTTAYGAADEAINPEPHPSEYDRLEAEAEAERVKAEQQAAETAEEAAETAEEPAESTDDSRVPPD